jgi:hypothetical protein
LQRHIGTPRSRPSSTLWPSDPSRAGTLDFGLTRNHLRSYCRPPSTAVPGLCGCRLCHRMFSILALTACLEQVEERKDHEKQTLHQPGLEYDPGELLGLGANIRGSEKSKDLRHAWPGPIGPLDKTSPTIKRHWSFHQGEIVRHEVQSRWVPRNSSVSHANARIACRVFGETCPPILNQLCYLSRTNHFSKMPKKSGLHDPERSLADFAPSNDVCSWSCS